MDQPRNLTEKEGEKGSQYLKGKPSSRASIISRGPLDELWTSFSSQSSPPEDASLSLPIDDDSDDAGASPPSSNDRSGSKDSKIEGRNTGGSISPPLLLCNAIDMEQDHKLTQLRYRDTMEDRITALATWSRTRNGREVRISVLRLKNRLESWRRWLFKHLLGLKLETLFFLFP